MLAAEHIDATDYEAGKTAQEVDECYLGQAMSIWMLFPMVGLESSHQSSHQTCLPRPYLPWWYSVTWMSFLKRLSSQKA
jgi:hypothetical protein